MPRYAAKRASFSKDKGGSKDPNRDLRAGLSAIPEHVTCADVQVSNDSVSADVPTKLQYNENDWSVAPPDDDFCLSLVDDDETYFDIPLENNVQCPSKIYVPSTEAECQDRRMAVKFFYERVYGAPPPTEWTRLGLVQKISRHVMTTRGGEKSVRATMEDIYCHIMTDCEYIGKRRSPVDNPRKAIVDDSNEMQFIADHIEQGLGLRYTTHLLNCNRLEEGKKPVGRTAVYNAMKRCKPVITAVQTLPQGSAKKNSDWAKARFNWVTQMLIRLGLFPEEKLDELRNEKGELPAYFDINKLTSLVPEQVAFFDETHKKQLIGNINRTDVRFYRDANGKLDIKNGKLRDPRPKIKAKFHKEARMVMGVAIDGDGVGTRLPLYDYTQKHVCYIGEWEDLIAKEIKRVKNLKMKKGPWYEKRRKDNVLYSGDPVGELPNIGEAIEKKLWNEDIVTISDLFLRRDAREILHRVGVRRGKLEETMSKEDEIEIGPPIDIDHQKAENPYESLYGEDWEEEICKCANLSPYVCITHIIKHIVKSCKAHFCGTKFATSWYFYHDALKQMTDKKCMDWMEAEGYLKHWVLPEEKLNQEFKRYFGRPVGNSPELMPLDTCLIKDVSDAVRRHAAITHKLDANYASKFDMSTPQRLMHCYSRIWNVPERKCTNGNIVVGGVPSPERIRTDFYKVFQSMREIYEAGGAIVPHCGTRSGKRARLVPKESKTPRGGRRMPMQRLELYWTHPDASAALASIMNGGSKQVAGKDGNDESKTSSMTESVPEIENCIRDDILHDIDEE